MEGRKTSNKVQQMEAILSPLCSGQGKKCTAFVDDGYCNDFITYVGTPISKYSFNLKKILKTYMQTLLPLEYYLGFICVS